MKVVNLVRTKRVDQANLVGMQSRIEFEWMFVVGFFVVGFHMDGVKITFRIDNFQDSK